LAAQFLDDLEKSSVAFPFSFLELVHFILLAETFMCLDIVSTCKRASLLEASQTHVSPWRRK
jgi:hypothetical protein